MSQTQPPRLEELATAELTMAAPLVIGAGPAGTRVVIDLLEGRFEGRLAGRLVGRSGADWLTIGPDGTGVLDVRLVLETDDADLVYVQSQGRMDLSPRDAADPVPPALLATTFETAAPSLAWLNRALAVTRADSDATRLRYTIMEVRA